MKRLALLLFVGLMPASILACDEAAPERTTETSRRTGDTEGTQVASVPTATSLLTNTAAPTAAPVLTATPVPAPTTAPVLTATAVTAPTAAPAPTTTPAPTTASQSAIAATLAPLGDNLHWVSYQDRATKKWLVYDATGNFNPEHLPLLPDMETPDSSDIGLLTELEPEGIYIFLVNEGQTVQLGGISYTFYRGSNPIAWR